MFSSNPQRGRCTLLLALLTLAALSGVAPGAHAAPTPPPNIAYLLDTTGSTLANCRDPEMDGTFESVLECEKQGLAALNASAATFSPVMASVIAFGSDAATVLDVDPAVGVQPQTEVAADKDGNGTSDINDAVQPLVADGGGTYDEPLTAVSTLPSFGPTLTVALLSDGDADYTTGPGSPLQTLVDAGVRIQTFSVGPTAAGCGAGAALSVIAESTGGTCTEVTDPTQLAWSITVPDSDGDGLRDNRDNCPTQSGPASNSGCAVPVVTLPPTVVTTTGSTADTSQPTLTALSLWPPAFRAGRTGSRVTFSVSERASVTFFVERVTSGRKVGGSCVAPTRANRRNRACTRWVRIPGSLVRQAALGKNVFRFHGKIGGKVLVPGPYRLTGRAKDSAGNLSTLSRRGFTILR